MLKILKKTTLLVCALLFMNGCSFSLFGGGSEETPAAPVTNGPEAGDAQAADEAAPKDEAGIKKALDKAGHDLVSRASRTVVPSKHKPSVKKVGKEYEVRYIEVDTTNIRTSLKPGRTKNSYVGIVEYFEETKVCRGATKEKALAGQCQNLGTRNVKELIRYDGKKWQW